MAREILVTTPENIEIEYELGGIGTRFLAYLIDTLWQALIYLGGGIVILVIYLLLMWIGRSAYYLLDILGGIIQGIAYIGGFLILWGYFIYFEIKWNGQTPGKRQMGLRVIRDGGYPLNAFGAITRNLLRVIDGMPIVAAVILIAGFFNKQDISSALAGASIILTICVMLFTARFQRTGDIVSGTMVVKQRAPRVPTLEVLAPPPRVLPEHLAAYALTDLGRHVYEMTVPEYRAVRYYTDRRWHMPIVLQQQAAMHLAVPMMQRLNIHPPEGVQQVNYADFLEYMAVAFEQYRGVK